MIASFISHGSTVQISEITINDPRIAGYAGYDRNGALTHAVFINSIAYLSTTTTPRGTVQLNINVCQGKTAPSNCLNSGFGKALTMSVRRLNIRYADDTAGLTFAGQSYETPNGLVSGKEVVETVPVLAGLTIKDTEAVLVEFI